MKLKKGSKAAKEYMASIRKMKKTSAKKVGAIKIVEKGESKNAKPSAVYQYNRTKKGTFKGLKKIGATKSSTHKDTKSHNVNIRVVSGINNNILSEIQRLSKYNDEIEKYIIEQSNRLKTDKSTTFNQLQKKIVKSSILRYKELLKSNKKHLTQLKKQIK